MTNLHPGDRAIAFSLPGVDGKTHAFDDYGNKEAVAVIFTCNHCPYARAWEDRLVQIQADYASKGVQLLAISSNDAVKYPDDSFDAMKQRAKDKRFNFPYLYDESQEIARAYGAERTPEIFLFDKNGVLQYHGAPDDNHEDPSAVKNRYLGSALDALLAGKTPAITQTQPVGCTIKWKPATV
jgi:peroxiredoxin